MAAELSAILDYIVLFSDCSFFKKKTVSVNMMMQEPQVKRN
jgi:hypothetical protein